MPAVLQRRNFLQLGLAASAAALLPSSAAQNAMSAPPPATPAAASPIKTTRLSENLWLLQGAGGNMALQSGPEGNILIDSSYADAVPAIRATVAALSHDAPDALINTHWHPDHTGGNEGLHQSGFTIVAHQKTRERLAEPHEMKAFHRSIPAQPAAALPTVTFDHALRLYHNGDEIALQYFEPAHTDTDISIHFRLADVLHVGDIWFNGMYPFIDEGTGGSIGGMIRAVDKALALAGGNTKIIPGHGPLGDKPALEKYRSMLEAIRSNVAALKTAGQSEAEAIAKKPTAAFDGAWGKGMMSPDAFTGIVYRTL